MKKIGICAGGGDCPGLNTVMHSIVRSLEKDYEIYGFIKSFDGLLDKNYIKLESKETAKIRSQGGTMLKSVNKGRFGGKVKDGKTAQIDPDLLKATFQSYQDLGLECLIVMGGDGTLSTAKQMQDYGFNIIGVPKSIDNDLYCTDYTFGFLTSVEIVNEALERLHTTATSHDRVMVSEVMGRNAGQIALYGGIAGGANAILIPEIPFSYKKILSFLENRYRNGSTSSIIVIAEGAKSLDGNVITKDIGSERNEIMLGGIGEYLAKFLNENSKIIEARNTSLGHLQRGGNPSGFDKFLSTRFGCYVGTMVTKKEYGKMVAFVGNEMTTVQLDQAVCKIKNIDLDGQMAKCARNMGIRFGDM